MQDQWLDQLIYTPAHYHCTTGAPAHEKYGWKTFSFYENSLNVSTHRTVAERGTAMRVDVGSNPAQTEVTWAIVRSSHRPTGPKGEKTQTHADGRVPGFPRLGWTRPCCCVLGRGRRRGGRDGTAPCSPPYTRTRSSRGSTRCRPRTEARTLCTSTAAPIPCSHLWNREMET